MTQTINILLGALALLLTATACGALWALTGLMGSGRAPWMALAVALLLALGLRYNGHPAGPTRAALAAVGLLLAIAHANYLMAAAFVAAQMGLELGPAIFNVGLDMAYGVTRAHGHAYELLVYGLALVLAVALGWRQPGDAGSAGKASTRGRRKPSS